MSRVSQCWAWEGASDERAEGRPSVERSEGAKMAGWVCFQPVAKTVASLGRMVPSLRVMVSLWKEVIEER